MVEAIMFGEGGWMDRLICIRKVTEQAMVSVVA